MQKKGSLTARTRFLSDIHLGFKRARARGLAAFLRAVDAETIILAGDIVDHLNLAQRIFWNDEHTRVVRALLAKRRAGARLIYIPGNHDSDLSLIAELLAGQVEVHRGAAQYIERFERVAAAYAAEQGFDGILCGHIHRANLRHVGPTLYCNTGDWVETCSAIIEEPSGELRLRGWSHAASRTWITGV